MEGRGGGEGGGGEDGEGGLVTLSMKYTVYERAKVN